MTDQPNLSDSEARKRLIAETAARLDEVSRAFEKLLLDRRSLPGVDAEAMERAAAEIREIRERKRPSAADRRPSNSLRVCPVLTALNIIDLKSKRLFASGSHLVICE